MFSSLEKAPLGQDPREGDLFKRLILYGKEFEIRYGYYEEIDRRHEPIPIYPNFLTSPQYTPDGYPFVTLMQNVCKQYAPLRESDDNDCGNCRFVERSDELIAVCKCAKNQRKNE